MRLETYGWDSSHDQEFVPEGCDPGRVIGSNRGIFHVALEHGDCTAELTGRYRYESAPEDWPITGDWVAVRRGQPRIEAVLPRRTSLMRRAAGTSNKEQALAANVDVGFIVTGLDHDFNLRRLERYLVLLNDCGVAPVFVLNKADLVQDGALAVERASALSGGAPVILTSAVKGVGIEQLDSCVSPGQTAVLLGSSGAGKSTILNALLGNEQQRVSAVREHDSRGRHTTTGRELFQLPQGWLLIDTPGLRELQLSSDESAVDSTFSDVSELAARCRFRDCRHNGEPGCAVAEAIDSGALDEGRLAGYHKLRREAAHVRAKSDEREARRQSEEMRRLHRQYRKIKHR